MEIRLVRHATVVVDIGGKKLLVDPMLSPPEAMPPIANTPNERRNPLVPLPQFDLSPIDAVLVTHTHADHFDAAAERELPENFPLLCQPEDEGKLRSSGFEAARAVRENFLWEGIEIFRTKGRHGTGEIGARMAPVSGFVLDAPGEPRLYIAGDTIWCPEVESAIDEHGPEVVVVNAGAARFVEGDPITMTAEDVARVSRHAPDSMVVAVHMEAINHCLLTREELRDHLQAEGLVERVLVPEDGASTAF